MKLGKAFRLISEKDLYINREAYDETFYNRENRISMTALIIICIIIALLIYSAWW
ncbi:MAG: hypothetical protein RLY40_999 [Pseudomonadota bacterium]|jgi:hypothetical protein